MFVGLLFCLLYTCVELFGSHVFYGGGVTGYTVHGLRIVAVWLTCCGELRITPARASQ